MPSVKTSTVTTVHSPTTVSRKPSDQSSTVTSVKPTTSSQKPSDRPTIVSTKQPITASPKPPIQRTCNLCFADGGKLAENLDICNKIQTVHTCSTNEFLNLGSTHCYTAALKYKLEYTKHSNSAVGSPFFSSRSRTLIVRGCANCTDETDSCRARFKSIFNQASNPVRFSFLDCVIKYCIGNNCNNERVSSFDKTPESCPLDDRALPTPLKPSSEEQKQALQISLSGISLFVWVNQTEETFKEAIALATTEYCTRNKTSCALKDRRRRIPSSGVNYTADQVHLLPGYPSGNLPGFLKVAFYVQQPPGLSIGNSSVLPRDTLLDIVLTYKSELERAIGINISDVEFWYKPSTTPGISPSSPVNTDSNVWKWIVIGVGAFLMLVLFGVLFKCWRRKKNSQERPRWIFAFDKPRKSMKNYSNANREGNRAADSAL